MTISDIAKMAGVSSAAVSRYFNNGYLSDDKKEAIRRAVEETGYHPSLQAQMLRTKKSKTIGVIIPRISSSTMSRIASGILEVLDENGYRMLLADTRDDPKKEREYMEVFDESQVDGMIIAGTIFSANYRKAINKQRVPVVIIGQDLAGFNSVYHDDYHAMYYMTELFIEKGKKKLGYIGVTEKDRAVGEFRYKGYCDALRQHGLAVCVDNYVISGFSMQNGYDRMAELYEAHPDLEVVLCATDRIAMGARKWIRENQPDQVEKILLSGQGDSEMVAVCYPPISTIHYYYEESGKIAAKRLMELISEGDNPEKGARAVTEVKLGYQIIDRTSY